MQQYHLPGLGRAGPFTDAPQTTIANVIQQLLAAKAASNRRPAYISSLAHYLRRFAAGREQRSLADFTSAEVEDWLKQFSAAGSRQTWLNRISTLFAFAERREIIASNPCKKIERVTIDRPPPKILTPTQSQTLLALVSAKTAHGYQARHTDCKPYLVLAMFAGIRPEEILRLDWKQICLETKTVRVDLAKTRRRRIVPLHERAVIELATCPNRTGPVAPSNVTVRRFKRAAREAIGFAEWPKDVLRHTAASYLLALHGDVARVAMMLGNSPQILMTHYHEPVNSADCAEFWRTG